MKKLDVYLNQNLTGYLLLDEGQMVFEYAVSWLYNSNAIPLSQSLPLQKERFSRKICRGFFAGILPEENKRIMVAKNLGISKTNDFDMLEKIGGECAGAIMFIPSGEKLPNSNYRYRKLSNQSLAEILKLLPCRPLMAGEEDVRLSLAGAQDKIAVHVAGEHISIPLGGAPSTHILKPAIEKFENVVFNEAFCMQLARLVGLPTAKVNIGRVDTIDYLLVERYDRHIERDSDVIRLHQEDFCQALSITSENKYQSEGGPSLKDCFSLLRAASSRPVIDLANLLDAVIFNLLIGNHDAHGKNFSLLYNGKNTQFAPLYDLISTVYYPQLNKKMSMKIGKEEESIKIMPEHFERLALDSQLAVPRTKKRVSELAEQILLQLRKVNIKHPVSHDLVELIEGRCQIFLKRFK